jgi:lipopolysaccharide/colanic/teichoic acid biosynthesis glycosyltransferase
MKRALDILGSAAGLLALAPVLLAALVAVWLEDRHSPFFRGIRVARGGGDFRMLKFRSMTPGAWKAGVNSTSASDPRITRVGRLLRAAKLDELPQLWNVLTGDMSLVGPRPQVRTDVNLYTATEREMLSVRPGITDLASIVFADEGAILDGAAHPDLLYNQIIRPWKSRLALLYVKRASFPTDIRVLLLTALAAVDRQRALEGVARILEEWEADEILCWTARRSEPLRPYPPPGSATVVEQYPAGAANAVPTTP